MSRSQPVVKGLHPSLKNAKFPITCKIDNNKMKNRQLIASYYLSKIFVLNNEN